MAKNHYNTASSYNYGSAAPDIYTDVPVPKVANPEEIRKLREEKRNAKRRNFKHGLSIYLSCVTIFIASIGFVWGSAVVSYKENVLQEAKAEIRDLKSQVNTTKALVASATNLDHIKVRAMEELNMAEPLAHQIIFLDIAKTSYTVTD